MTTNSVLGMLLNAADMRRMARTPPFMPVRGQQAPQVGPQMPRMRPVNMPPPAAAPVEMPEQPPMPPLLMGGPNPALAQAAQENPTTSPEDLVQGMIQNTGLAPGMQLPQDPNATGTMPAPDIMKKPGFMGKLTQLLSDPRSAAFLQNMGMSLLRPKGFGESGMAQWAGSLMAGQQGVQQYNMYQALQAQAQREQAITDSERGRKAGLEERKVGVEEKTATTGARKVEVDETQGRDRLQLDKDKLTREDERHTLEWQKNQRELASEERRLKIEQGRLDELIRNNKEENEINRQNRRVREREASTAAARLRADELREQRMAITAGNVEEIRLIEAAYGRTQRELEAEIKLAENAVIDPSIKDPVAKQQARTAAAEATIQKYRDKAKGLLETLRGGMTPQQAPSPAGTTPVAGRTPGEAAPQGKGKVSRTVLQDYMKQNKMTEAAAKKFLIDQGYTVE